ncbi:glycosyltransferase [Microcoleus sp. FACHB-68]|uniref:glycosyltransferase n=1 Tax=Microcoleus sp. FACHB-68 TaxID=2692826 RepID=UPI00168447A5|nr:glycosyltransferase [Microcoleus sp. FACHB-68]MBD1939418.1 glycosyltransferase [Microcoleus sp. FACHB-68]
MSPSQANNFSNPAFLPRVSVIVPIYNGEADLPDLLNCLRLQTYPTHLVEYLLVDNNSSDHTGPLIASAGEGFRHLSENQIQSSYAARNTGIRAATGNILAFTDADCRPNPNWLNTLIQPFVKENVGIVAGEIEALAGETLLEKYASRQDTLSQKHTLAHPFCPYGQTANLAIRRQVLEEVGLFRPYLTTGGDADICWRILRQTHWQLEFAPDAIVQHRHRSTLRQLRSQWRRYGESNKYLHELHGIDLMRELTAKEYLYRLSRWLLKELPAASVKASLGKAGLADLLSTPLDLFCFQARTTGQREANLAEKAREIEQFIQP